MFWFLVYKHLLPLEVQGLMILQAHVCLLWQLHLFHCSHLVQVFCSHPKTHSFQSMWRGAEDVAQLGECLPILHETLGSVLNTIKSHAVMHTCNPSTGEVEAGGSNSKVTFAT